jgi:hypothetical protein
MSDGGRGRSGLGRSALELVALGGLVVAGFLVVRVVSDAVPAPTSEPTRPTVGAVPVRPPRPSFGPGGARSVVILTGSGSQKSKVVPLKGDYVVAWAATPDSDAGCHHGATLVNADLASSGAPSTSSPSATPAQTFLVDETLEDSSPALGTTHLSDLSANDYYVDADSGCDWSFTFTPSDE